MLEDLSQRTIQKKRWLWFSEILVIKSNLTTEPKNNCLSEQISVYTRILPEFPLAYTITYHDLQQFNISQSNDINGKEVGFGRKLMDHLSGGIELFPEQAFNIEWAYNVKHWKRTRCSRPKKFLDWSFSFGIKISFFWFDYSMFVIKNADLMWIKLA